MTPDAASSRVGGSLASAVLLVGIPAALLTRSALPPPGRWWPLFAGAAVLLGVVAVLLTVRRRITAAVGVALVASAGLVPLPLPWPLPLAPLVVTHLAARRSSPRSPPGRGATVSVGALLFGLLAGVVAAAVALVDDQVIVLDVAEGLPALATPLLLVLAAGVNGLSEEVAWRGVPRQLTRLTTAPLVAVTSASFAAAHLSTGVPSGGAGLVAAAGFGTVVGGAYFSGRWSFADAVRCHVVTDLTLLSILDVAGKVWT